MRTSGRPRPDRQQDVTARSRLRTRSLRGALVASVAVLILGSGVITLQDPDSQDGSAAALVSTVASVPEPQQIPVAAAPAPIEVTTGEGMVVEKATPAPVEEEIVIDSPGDSVPAEHPVDPPELVPTEDVPQGSPTTLSSGGATQTVARVSGTGTIRLGFTRTESSAAPNLPTYVSAICDGESVYSGAFNTTTAGPVVQDVPFSGSSCVVKVKVAQPSPRWAGTSSAVVVTRDAAAETQQGSPYVEDATWTTTAVTGSDAFEIAVPEGFTGTVSVKLTACSSEGGTSDATRDFACGEHVEKGVGSEGTITVSDGEQLLASTSFDISAETHHDMVTLDIEEPAADDLVVGVERTDGSAVLVHGPGTGAVGTH